MRAVFIGGQCEFKLEVSGDEFHQGNPLPCTLFVKNHASEKKPLEHPSLHLALGDIKEAKKKSAEAFQILASAEFPALLELAPQEQKQFPWTFQLDRNSPITEKARAIFFLIGNSTDLGALHQLPLTVQTHPYIREFYRTLETSHQFVFKGEKWSGGWVTAKLKPPAGQRFPLVNELNLSSRFDGDAIELKYLFKVKGIGGTGVTAEITKGTKEVLQRLEKSEYLLGGQYINNSVLDERVAEALSGVQSSLS